VPILVLKNMSSLLTNKSVPEESRNRRPSAAEQKKQLENDNEQSLQKMRKEMFVWVKWCVSIYLIVVTAIILIQVFYMGRSLSDNVLIALLVTTTGNVLGLPYLIIKAIFQK
jgi:hypothetical protein